MPEDPGVASPAAANTPSKMAIFFSAERSNDLKLLLLGILK